jgi:RND family efflux transporter MFP subunit
VSEQISGFKQLLISVALVLAGAGAWYMQDAIKMSIGLSSEQHTARSGQRSSGVPVIVAPVTFASDQLQLRAVGTGRALRSVSLRTEAAGKIVELAILPGARFRTGDALLKLEDTDQRLAVEIARARLKESQRALRRAETLGDSGTTALARVQQLRTEAEIAKLELDRAEDALSDRVLRAPFDGVSGLATVEVGAWVDSDVDVASFDDRTVLLVEFDMPEALLPRIELGMPVAAVTASAPDQRLSGEIAAIDSRITASSRTTKVRVSIPNPDDRLRPGASFTVILNLPGKTYPAVPELSLQFSRGSLFVWRVKGDQAEQVEVTMQRRQAGTVLVDGPLAAGDLVVVEGTQRLERGKKIMILDTQAKPTS